MNTVKQLTYLGLSLLLLATWMNPLSAQPTGSVHIQNATVLTISDGDLENTDVVIEDGIITEIGQDLSTPSGAEAIDATGKYVMPGIVDAHSHVAISRGVNEATNPVTAEVSIRDAVDPNDVNIYRALAGGVTSAQLKHGSANVIGGQSATVKFRYGESAETMKYDDAPQLIKFALGENPTRVHGQGRGIKPRTRMGVEQVVREKFDKALDYRRAREEYLEQKEQSERWFRRGDPPQPVPKNERLEVIADIIEGEVVVQCHSYRADEIQMLMRVFDDYDIDNLTFHHIIEGYKVAPELAEHGYHASSFMDWWSFKVEAFYATTYNPTIMNDYGVLTSIHSDSAEIIRHLNHEAAKAVKYGGTSKNDALAMITLNPATQMGIDDQVGSIEEGKHGDVSIWTDHPLSIYAVNEHTFVDGVEYFNRHEDEDDQRLDVDPETEFQAGSFIEGRHEDACIHGQNEEEIFYLFEEGNYRFE